jgi:hypothetical protein
MSTTDEMIKNYSGIFGNQVILRNRRNRSVMTIPRKRNPKEPTESQRRVRERFTLAARYAVNVLQDPDMLAAYTLKARFGMAPYVVAMTDYLRPPVVTGISTADYDGNPGSRIHVEAYDDFAVTGVSVSIRDASGAAIEKGECVQDPLSGSYDYTATVAIGDLAGVKITAQARDYPGHVGELVVTL